MRKTHSRLYSNCPQNYHFKHQSPINRSSMFRQNNNANSKRIEETRLNETKSVKTFVSGQPSIQARLRDVQVQINSYKKTIELLEKTIYDLDQLNAQLINSSKQYSTKLQQFTIKANRQLQQKDKTIEMLQFQIKKYESENISFSMKQFQTQSVKQLKIQTKTQELLLKKQRQYANLLEINNNLRKQKNEQVAFYDQIIEQKQQTIIKMAQFNNELCMKLLDKKIQEAQLKFTENAMKNNFDFCKNYQVMKDKLFRLMEEKEYFTRKIDEQNQKIHELKQMYEKATETIKALVNHINKYDKYQKIQQKLTIIHTKQKSETSSSRSSDTSQKQSNNQKIDKISSSYSLYNLLKNQFTFSQEVKEKENTNFEEDFNIKSSNTSENKEQNPPILSKVWSFESN